jgi:hypothetical protein
MKIKKKCWSGNQLWIDLFGLLETISKSYLMYPRTHQLLSKLETNDPNKTVNFLGITNKIA